MAITNPFKNLSKPQLYAVIGGGLLIGGYAEYAHHKKTGSWSPFATAPVSTAAGTGIDPLTSLPYADDSAVDPVTEQQYLAEAEQYGSVAAAEAAVSAYGQSTATGSGIGVNPASPPSTGSVNTTVGGSIYTSNSAWAQAVQAGLSAVSGSAQYDGTDIGEAIGAYLQGMPLDPQQQKVVSTAIAEYGKPPVGDFQIIPGGTTPTGTTTTTGANSVLINIHDGTGHWQAATFPNAAAVTTFLNSLGAHLDHSGVLFGPDVGQVWPTEPSPQAIDSALTAVGGSLAGPPGQSGNGIVRFQGGIPTGQTSW